MAFDLDTVLLIAAVLLLAYEVLKPPPKTLTQQILGAAPGILTAVFA